MMLTKNSDPRTIAVFEHGSKQVQSVIVIINGVFKWAFIDAKTKVALHPYEGNHITTLGCLEEIDNVLKAQSKSQKAPERTRIL